MGRLVFVQVLLLLALVVSSVALHLSIDLLGVLIKIGMIGSLAGVSHLTRHDRGPLSRALWALVFLLTGSLLLSLSQYPAVALGRPTIDATLAAWDHALGLSVVPLVQWTAGHPWLRFVLSVAYGSLIVQLALPVLVLGLVHQDFRRLWSFVAQFHVAAIVTVLCLALWPAACTFSYTGVPSLLDQTRFLHQFDGFRTGTLTLIPVRDLEGLISFPSFHVAGALLATWALWNTRWRWPLVALNILLCASTVLLGAHYVIDLLATGGVWLGGLLAIEYLPAAVARIGPRVSAVLHSVPTKLKATPEMAADPR